MLRWLIGVTLVGGIVACAEDASTVAGPAEDASTGGQFAGGSGGFPGGTGGSGGAPTGGTGGSGGAPQGGTAGVAAGGTAGVATGGTGGIIVQCVHNAPCSFPQGVPDEQFIAAATAYADTDPAVDAAVNSVMASLTGCGVLSDCDIVGFPGANADEICQSWFAAVTQALRDQGFCAGQHAVGSTDEIAVSNTCCEDKWYGYHICNYGGPKVVWNPGARRGWWMINPSYCGT